jgi:hypothetical protein
MASVMSDFPSFKRRHALPEAGGDFQSAARRQPAARHRFNPPACLRLRGRFRHFMMGFQFGDALLRDKSLDF